MKSSVGILLARSEAQVQKISDHLDKCTGCFWLNHIGEFSSESNSGEMADGISPQ